MVGRMSKPAVVAACAVLALCCASAAARVEVEDRMFLPDEWRMGRPTPEDTELELVIAVKQQNTDVLESELLAVSDPDSPRYSQHMSFEEVQELVAPKRESVEAVLGWLRDEGVDVATAVSATPNSDFVTVRLSASRAWELLDARFFEFTNVHTGTKVQRVSKLYTLPEAVAAHVDFVGPTTRFPAENWALRQAAVRRGAARQPLQFGGVTPKFLRQLYNVGTTEGSASGNLQAVASFLKQYYSPTDLASFFKQFYPTAEGRHVSKVVGPNSPSQPGIEASLDIEYLMSMGGNVETQFWSTPGNAPGSPENEPFLSFMVNVSSTKNAPWVISASYGDNENTVSLAYAQRINSEFQKAGLRGISIMFSSGDGGVAGGQPSSCTTFVPTYPAGSPWVTAVGGSTGSQPETAASLSAGGFSNYWSRPAYQTDAVSKYMSTATGLPSPSVYNHTGAGIPDVAAQAQGFSIVYDGFPTGVDGTSCSAPTFSGIVSLLNDARLAAGKKTLGYLNPLFYKNAAAFNDVTSGSNPGCGTEGFQAAKGWDPVTGLGTPDFAKLKKIVLALP